MVNLCEEAGLNLEEVMQAKPFWMDAWDEGEEYLITFYEN